MNCIIFTIMSVLLILYKQIKSISRRLFVELKFITVTCKCLCLALSSREIQITAACNLRNWFPRCCLPEIFLIDDF